MSFERSWLRLHAVEGEFSDEPTDRGGKTRFGVTEVVARANGYDGPMEALPLATAKRIAKAQYWDLLRLDEVAALNEDLAHELLDTGYNMGVGIAGRFLQRALNGLNRGAIDYPDLVVDGVVGHVTLAWLQAYERRRGDEGMAVLLRALNGFQLCRYFEIAERDETQEAFVYGWIRARVA